VACLNPASRGKFGDEQSLSPHLGLKRSVVTGVDPFQGGAEDTDRNSARLKATSMNGPIDSLCQTANNGPTRLGQHGTQSTGHQQTMV
jgi:hypothetical protein